MLPTSKFRIYKTNDEFSNTAMISNDTLKVQIFAKEIAYGNLSQPPLAKQQSFSHRRVTPWISKSGSI